MAYRRIFYFLLLVPVFALAQNRTGGEVIRAAEAADLAMDASIQGATAQAKARAVAERERFALRFNRLVTAVKEFSEEYNKAEGSVWPQKRADEVEKAYRELQKLDSWRRSTALNLAKSQGPTEPVRQAGTSPNPQP